MTYIIATTNNLEISIPAELLIEKALTRNEVIKYILLEKR
jgi:hypothetical protein